ncbi:glycoside hydrolase [Brevundimonas sp. LM2]|uniref:glycoside hydrolase family 9 protein n=1 Tax=Brevundimonas sp. LM2 TaxID=1938605 RepID=UPI000983EC37|nr:glycoside hydrolase family 9 protein [Brevundimonas sp. LM2]AQR60256.1 glycoside hydrolase [Brevundimonas sp. LM2]
MKHPWASLAVLLATASAPAMAQDGLRLNEAGYLEARGVNWLVFSNWYDGLFADSKISGVELIQQGVRTATNGDVRLSATPGQWDPIGALVSRTVDPETGAITAVLEYADHGFRYTIVATPRGEVVTLEVVLDQPLPAALVGQAGLNLEFLPSAYVRRSFMADGAAGLFPLHPAGEMVAGGPRNAASGRDFGPGAEPLPFATGGTVVLAPEDPARRVTVTAETGDLALFDGRNQAQNGWFVLRSLIPGGRTGSVVRWTLAAHSVPDWVRPAVIGHSQIGYAPQQPKVAVIEMDRNAAPAVEARLIRIGADGAEDARLVAPAEPWGAYLRYDYRTFDFSTVQDPGLYVIEAGGTRTAPFRIAGDALAGTWRPTSDVFLPVQMDHMFVNEAYRVWHGDPHRDDARQAPLNHEHIDLYRQGPTTDTRFEPGEHIPGLAVGGWLDAGDFDQRTQTQYAAIRSLVSVWEAYRPARDQTLIDQSRRRVELHVPDGEADILQQVEHGTLQLVAQFDAVGHAIHGIVEPDVAQYTHLGDAGSKTDGLIYDPALAPGEQADGRSGDPDDRWVFTSRSSALNYGSIAALAAASRVLKDFRDPLAAKSLAIAERIWAEEQGREPATFRHGNTTGGPLEVERFTAAVELLLATGKPIYAEGVAAGWADLEDPSGGVLRTALQALPLMPADYRAQVEATARRWAARSVEIAAANPYGVPIGTGGWAGSGQVIDYGLTAHALHAAFPEIVDGQALLRAVDFIHGNHPGSDVSLVSGVGTVSKEVAYGSNRADFSFIAGGVVPGVLIIKPDFPENKEDWPFLWGENEYVVNLGPSYIELMHAAEAFNAARAD